jgi:Glycosyltransferase family 28 C-terminal domain
VPIIRELEKQNKIIIGVTPLTKRIFDEEFPHLQKVNVPAYNINYSQTLALSLKLLLLWPSILKTIKKEKKCLAELIQKHKIDLIISDNRFGFYSEKITSIFITHQVFLKTPFANNFAQNINKKFILNFNEVWIPDYENESESLAGQLSHGNHYHKNVKYIGPKSRLIAANPVKIKFDYLFLLSGPEPNHSMLAKKLIDLANGKQEKNFALTSNLFLGEDTANLQFFYAPTSKKLVDIIAQSQTIICRSGYSTLMDLHLLGKKNILLIPTKGQTEQEYLADYWQLNYQTKTIPETILMEFADFFELASII